MHFKEIVIQGLFGVVKGLRLPLSAGLCEPLLPPPLDVPKFQRIIALVLYPQVLGPGIIQQLDSSVPYPIRLGAVLESGGLEYKLMWDFKEDSLQVLSESGVVLASGPEETQSLWEKVLGLVPFDYFYPLHFHSFFQDSSAVLGSAEVQRLVEEYRRSLSTEAIENQIVNVEAKLRELLQVKSPAVKVEAALERCHTALKAFEALPELSDDERRFVTAFDRLDKTQTGEIEEMERVLRETMARRDPEAMRSLFANRWFWLGGGLGVLCLVAAIVFFPLDGRLRALALGAIVGFGTSVGALWRHLDRRALREELDARVVTLESRLKEVQKTQEREQGRMKRMLKRFAALSAEQIIEDVDKRNELRDKRGKLEERLKGYINDAVFIRQRKEIAEVKAELEEIKKRRAEMGDFVMPAYELRGELEKQGVAVDTIRGSDAIPEAELIALARELKMIPPDATVIAPLLEPLNRMIPAVIGQAQAQVAIENNGLVVTLDRTRATPLSAMVAREQLPWLRAVALGLLVQHHKERTRIGDHVSLVVLDDPWAGMQRQERVRFYGLLKDVAKSFQVVIPKVGE